MQCEIVETVIEEFIVDDRSQNFENSRKYVEENVSGKKKRDYYNRMIDLKFSILYDSNTQMNIFHLWHSGKNILEIEPYADYFFMYLTVEGARFERQYKAENEEEWKKSREKSWNTIREAFDQRAKMLDALAKKDKS